MKRLVFAALPVFVVCAALYADVVSDLAGVPGPAGATGPTGAAGNNGADPAGLGLSCGPTGVQLNANGGVRMTCSTSNVHHVELLGSTNGAASTMSRVPVAQAGAAALVVTATGSTTAVYLENKNSAPGSGIYALKAGAFASDGGTIDLENARIGLPLRWVTASTTSDTSTPKAAIARCAANERPLTGSCLAGNSTNGPNATFTTRCYVVSHPSVSCAIGNVGSDGFKCTASHSGATPYYVQATVGCMAE